jgi:hypothetical protein
MTTTVTVQAQTAAGHVQFDCEDNIGPLGARRSMAAASRLLERYEDLLADEDVLHGAVLRVTDAVAGGTWYVPALAYNRPVRR